LHGREDPATVDRVWPHLGHPDRAIRFAARVALEAQPAATWRDRALGEANVDTSLTALLGLARQGSTGDQARIVAQLNRLSWNSLSTEQRLRTLRVHELAFARGGEVLAESRAKVANALRGQFPDKDARVNRELSRLLCFLGDTTMIEPLLERMAADTGDRPLLGSGNFVRNPKYGAAMSDMLQAAPRIEAMHSALNLLWLEDDWRAEQRRRYFESMADALLNSRGGHGYRDFWGRIRETALQQLPQTERPEFEDINVIPMALAEGLPAAKGPGRDWTLEEAMDVVGRGLQGRDRRKGRETFAAAGCVVCHQIDGEGAAVGPDLSTVGLRFTVRDILEATIDPSKAMSDQYQMVTLELTNGQTLSGRVVSKDVENTRIATQLMRPTESVIVPNSEIHKATAHPVSTMPSGLLNALNEDELLDLIAYLKGAPQGTTAASADRE
jgi:putative heme-binding domain-containing protein